MPNAYYNYSGNFLPGTLARAESIAAEYSLVATGFSKLSIQGVDTGVANAYVVTTTGYPIAAYQDGNNVQFKALNPNSGASTINVNGIGAVPLQRFNGGVLVAGDISAGSWYTLTYQSTFGGFTITAPSAYSTSTGTISGSTPSHKVGLVAAGGVSTAAAPIDATYAIDQAIVPTWTGLHTFNAKVVIGAPASGNSLTVTPVAGGNGLVVNNSGATAALTVASAGNVTVAAPSSGVAFTVTGVAGASAAQFLTTGVQVGSPTGGDKGAGTINVASAFYINNVSVTAGTTVSSITGTANQIAASASTGAVTLSFPNNVVLPTIASGTALTATINGGGTNITINDIGTFGVSMVVQYGSSYIGLLGSNSKAVSGGNNTDIGIAAANSLVLATGGTQGAATARVTIDNTGGVIVGAAASQGAGTLAALTQLYVGAVPMYRTGTFTGTLTGMTAGTTGTVTYVIAGNTATLSLGAISGTSNTTAMTMTGVPAVLQPASLAQNCPLVITDNGSPVAGLASIAAGSGTITFYRDILATGVFSTTGFTAAGTKGTSNAVITYSLL